MKACRLTRTKIQQQKKKKKLISHDPSLDCFCYDYQKTMVDYFLTSQAYLIAVSEVVILKQLYTDMTLSKCLKKQSGSIKKKRLSMSVISSQRLGVFEKKFQHCLFATDEYTLNTTSQNKTIR